MYRLVNQAHVALACAVLSAPGLAQVRVEARNQMELGWMPGGWGSYQLLFENPDGESARVVEWSGAWLIGGVQWGDPFGGSLDVAVPAGGSARHDDIGYAPEELFAAAGEQVPQYAGHVTMRAGETEYEVPFAFDVPAAVLPEPVQRQEGKFVALELMESRFEEYECTDNVVRLLDLCYEAMAELTGLVPYDGEKIAFREAPPHPFWAYAGNPIILNSDYVSSTMDDFERGIVSFGWVHEMGHDFDVLGDWYCWNGPAAECQANFKLGYALETIDDPAMRIAWTFQAPDYPAPDATILLPGRELVERFFVRFGDAYLADPHLGWDSMASDDLHSMLMRVQRTYGWEPFRALYRTYGELAANGAQPPESVEEKIALMCAILSREAGVSLVPLFERWRLPVDEEAVAEVAAAYGLE